MNPSSSLGSQSAFARIRAASPQLSAKEQQIAEYILEHPDQIIHLSITELADLCECAEATIFRLCRRLGYRGYQAFKIALASEVVAPLQSIHQEIQPDDDLQVLAEKIFTANMETLRDSLQILNRETLALAIEWLSGATRIEFYGCGGSAVIAQDAYHKFMRIGIPCVWHADPHYQVMSAALLKPGAVVVGISHSGSNKDILEAVKVAKQAGATTIGITSYGKSPLNKLVDLCLFTASRETVFRTEALSSRLAQLSLLDLLYVAVSLRHQDETVLNIQKIREAISLKRL
ncbi:MurR/RpiR family transcriptional regulator [Brevibacillus sp. SYP-B805]|uniref:MurR/RpiR family transcriptional regulator n=1 Tax=Brevibacillus sp. SYP-B805 TaxID=1578199 RepID=UPI0013EB0A3C|nr:MurR/RpiR family transcriptional regulator [Brevibacillus sp. SYP-B805]NGQ97376.1 MurR/RpiR family transcriptional regulator [Brevibacillus sp. SYP-B805]